MPGKYLAVLLLTFFGFSKSAIAQDLEPRRWSHLPTGLNILGAGYIYTEADIYFSPFWKIENGDTRMNILALTAMHTFDMAGKAARISILLPNVNYHGRAAHRRCRTLPGSFCPQFRAFNAMDIHRGSCFCRGL